MVFGGGGGADFAFLAPFFPALHVTVATPRRAGPHARLFPREHVIHSVPDADDSARADADDIARVGAEETGWAFRARANRARAC